MTGFTFWMPDNGGTDYFIETKNQKRTMALSRKIIREVWPDSDECLADEVFVTALRNSLIKATCEIGETSTGRKYYKIWGENFGGRGSWLDDGKTVILHL